MWPQTKSPFSQVGKELDALIVNPLVEGGPFDLFDSDATLDVLEKWLTLGDDRNIHEVYVKGRCVVSKGARV